MGFKKWFKEGVADNFKEQTELDIIAGAEQLIDGFPKGNMKTQIYKESDGTCKIKIVGGTDVYVLVDDIEWEESAKRSGGKAAGGAIVGGVVGGVVGAGVGAAVGGRRRDNSKAFVYMTDVNNEREITLHINCDQTKYSKIASFRR